MEGLYFLVFLAFAVGVYAFAKKMKGKKNTGATGSVSTTAEDREIK